MATAADTSRVRSTRRPLVLLLASLTVLMTLTGVASSRVQAATTAGVQLHVLWQGVDDDAMDRQLRRLKAGGARLARVDVGWGSLQAAGPGRWDRGLLRRLDRLVARAEAHDVDLLLTLADSPCWASSAPRALKAGCAGRWWRRGVHRYLPRDPGTYARALAFLTDRYEGRVRGWEIWNEPNSEAFSAGPDKARRYAALVRAAYPRAKRAAPGTLIVAGAVSEADTAFVADLYRAGIRGAFDALSMHPYSQDKSPIDRREGGNQRLSLAAGVPAVRRVMLDHGDERPLWLTEFGWSTSRVRNAGPFERGVDERRQALYVRQALDHVGSLRYVPVIVYYNLKDRSQDRGVPVDNYGLLRYDGTPKPAFRAFADAARALTR